MANDIRIRWCLALTLALSPRPTSAQVASSNYGQVVERCGIAAGLRLGRNVSGTGLSSAGPAVDGFQQYHGADGSVAIGADAAGVIREITVARPGTFTQRYIVIGQSTLGDVLQRYGKPTSSKQLGPRLIVDYVYDGVYFTFPQTGNGAALQSNVIVGSATVHEKTAPPGGTGYACAASAK